MATPTWQQILARGQQTIAVWNQHAPAFTVRGLTLAQHQTDVNALAPKAQQVEDEQDAVDDARAARDAVQKTVATMNTQMPRKLDGDLLPDDPYHKDLKDIRSVTSDTAHGTLTRGQKVVSLWKKLNARNAAATPVIPALLVGGVAFAAFDAHVQNLDNLQQTVEDEESDLRDVREELRVLAARVDQNNKRWYAAWQGEFLPGSPEYAALAQIETEGGGSGGGNGEPPPTPPEPPGPPQNPGLIPGAVGSGELAAQCEVPEGATGLKIYRISGGGSATLLATLTDVTALPHTLTFDPDENVEIHFTATNAGGEGEPSVSVSATAP